MKGRVAEAVGVVDIKAAGIGRQDFLENVEVVLSACSHQTLIYGVCTCDIVSEKKKKVSCEGSSLRQSSLV